jgi:hypothetical protein
MQLRGVPGGDRPLVQWLMVALAVAIVVLAARVVLRERDARETIRRLEEELRAAAAREEQLERSLARERAAREAFEIGLGRERASNAPPGIPLEGGLDPSGRPKQQIRLPDEATRVRFVLPLKGPRLARYRAGLRTFSGGEELWSHAVLRADADPMRLFVTVPYELLAPGAYELMVVGFTDRGERKDVDAYTFEITSRPDAEGRRPK